jgi:hypothetical protein
LITHFKNINYETCSENEMIQKIDSAIDLDSRYNTHDMDEIEFFSNWNILEVCFIPIFNQNLNKYLIYFYFEIEQR